MSPVPRQPCFRWDGEQFDVYHRPRRIERAQRLQGDSGTLIQRCSAAVGSLRHGFVDDIVYHDHSDLWVLGQTARIDRTDLLTAAATVPERTTYTPAKAQPEYVYAFEKLQRRLSYHPHGLPKEIYDGRQTGDTWIFRALASNGMRRNVSTFSRHEL